ncbi:hypothetical protein ACFRKB_35125 [Streptomyces scopuliridis]|uniref:hypothetical protein n=1 Tax=Streptomyces scopuliridis TaxID=452529 RepID=UPI003694B7D8
MTLSGCSSDDSTDNSPSATTSPSAPQSSKAADPTETAKKDAVAVYRAYWQEMEKLYADPNGKNVDLPKYAASAALKNAEADAKRAHDGKRIYNGEVTVVNPTVTSLNIDREIPNATISSCLDISRWKVTHADTGKPVELPASRLTKYLIVSTVERYPDGWRVIRDDPQGKPC